MIKKIRLWLFSLVILAISSCAIISKDDFVYLGHPESLPEYQIYYDKTENLYLFLDKHGCFDKSVDGSGTCIAVGQDRAQDFVKDILPKMLERENAILNEKSKEKIIKFLKQSNKKAIRRPVDVDFRVRPVKQINVNKKKEYHLVPKRYKLEANIIIMLDSSKKDKDIKVLYSFRIPKVMKKQKTSTKPFLVDPIYLKKIMSEDAIHEAEELQTRNLKLRQEREQSLADFLKDELHL